MNPHFTSFVTGIVILMAAAFLGIREICLRDGVKSLPIAPFWVRTCMFAFMVTLTYRGVDILTSWSGSRPITVDSSGMLVAVCLMAYHLAMLCNVLSQRYSPEVWAKLYRIEKLAKCRRNGPALAQLFSQGWTVWAPKESALPERHLPN